MVGVTARVVDSDRLVILAFMTSGNLVQFECDEFEISRFPEHSERAWDMAGYRFRADSPVKYKLIELDVNRVEAIVEVKPDGEARERYTRTRNQDRPADQGEIGEESEERRHRVQGDQDSWE